MELPLFKHDLIRPVSEWHGIRLSIYKNKYLKKKLNRKHVSFVLTKLYWPKSSPGSKGLLIYLNSFKKKKSVVSLSLQ